MGLIQTTARWAGQIGGDDITQACYKAADSHEVPGAEGTVGKSVLTPGEIAARVAEPLTADEITLVQDTWKQAASLGVENVGILLFKHIFKIAPDALLLFSFKKEPNVRSYETPGLRAHGLKVVTTVGVAVDSLQNLPAVVPTLQALAVKHVGYGVAAEHYDVVGKALMATLRDGLGATFTTKVEIAWGKVWKVVSTTMIEAAKPIFEEKKKKEAQEHALKEKQKTMSHRAASVDSGPFTRAEIHEVQESWGKVMAGGTEAVAIALFKHIFSMAPEALQLFKFKDEWKNLYDSPGFKTHAVGVIKTVNVAVDSLTHLGSLVPILQQLGTKHVGYRVKKPHYEVVGQALIQTLSDALDNLFTESCKKAWIKVWTVVAATMQGEHYA